MIQLSKQGDILTAVLDRQLDAGGVRALQDALRGQLGGVRHLVLDANQADVIDRTGIEYLQLLDEKMLNREDGTFRLVNLGEGLRDLLEAEDWMEFLPEWDQ